MTDIIWKREAKKFAQIEIERIDQRRKELIEKLNDNPIYRDLISLENPERDALEYNFLSEQRKELFETCTIKEILKLSWSGKHDFRTDMKVDYSYDLWEYILKSDEKSSGIYGLRWEIGQRVNTSRYRSKPDWCQFSHNDSFYRFKLGKEFSLQDLEESLRDCEKKRKCFSLSENKLQILDSG